MSEICFKCQSQKTIQLEKYNLLTKQAKEKKTLKEKKRKREEEEQKLRYTAPKEDTDTSNPWKVVVIDLTKDS